MDKILSNAILVDLDLINFLLKEPLILIKKKIEFYKDIKKDILKKFNLNDFDDRSLISLATALYIKTGFFKNLEELEFFLNDNKIIKKNIYSNEREIYIDYWNRLNLGNLRKFTPNEVIAELIYIKKSIEIKSILKDRKFEELEKLDSQIEEKKREYKSLPSILDSISELKEPEVIDNDEVYLPWWNKMGLKKNPFKTTDGLSQINKENYEEIIVKTPLIDKYSKKLQYDLDSIYSKSFIFFGEYGSGKTTTFEFLSNKMINYKIFPIYILLRCEQDKFILSKSFEFKLYEELCKEFNKISEIKISLEILNYEFKESIKLMKRLTPNNEGFIIFIDGLNQSDNYSTLLPFLRDLQIYQNNLVREGINISFFIAGANEWKQLIINDPSLTGSIEEREQLPTVTPDEAYKMINNRFAVYSKNKKNPKKVKLSFIKQIYRDLENKNLRISYRSFILAIKEKLASGHFDIIDNIKVDKEILNQIREKFEDDEIIDKKFKKLLYSKGIQKNENRLQCLKILIAIFLDGGIRENSIYLVENQFYFKRLEESQLIVKSNIKNELFWQVTPELKRINNLILKEFNYSIEDFLISLYGSLSPKRNKVKNAFKDRFQIAFNLIENNKDYYFYKEDLEISFSFYEDLIQNLDDSGKKIKKETIRNCNKYFDKLSRIFFIIEKFYSQEEIKYFSVDDLWKKHWNRKEIIFEFLKRKVNVDEISDEKDCRIYCDRFKDFYNFIIEEIIFQIKERNFYLGHELTNLSETEMVMFNDICILGTKSKKDLNKIVRVLSKYNQRKFRIFLNNIFTLMYGSNTNKWLEDRLDPNTRSYIKENLYKSKLKPVQSSENIFTQLNRGNYKEFITQNNSWAKNNWKEIFQYVFKGFTKSEFEDFLSKYFIESLMEEEHDKESIISENYVRNLIFNSVNFIRDLNKAYLFLLTEGLWRCSQTQAFYFSFIGYDLKCGEFDYSKGINNVKSLTPINIDKEILEEFPRLSENVKEILSSNNLKFYDVDIIKGFSRFMVSYRNYFFYFALILQQDKFIFEDKDKLRLSGRMLIEQGEKFLLKITQI